MRAQLWSLLVVTFNRQLAVWPKFSSLFCSSSFFSRVTESRVKQVMKLCFGETDHLASGTPKCLSSSIEKVQLLKMKFLRLVGFRSVATF